MTKLLNLPLENWKQPHGVILNEFRVPGIIYYTLVDIVTVSQVWWHNAFNPSIHETGYPGLQNEFQESQNTQRNPVLKPHIQQKNPSEGILFQVPFQN